MNPTEKFEAIFLSDLTIENRCNIVPDLHRGLYAAVYGRFFEGAEGGAEAPA